MNKKLILIPVIIFAFALSQVYAFTPSIVSPNLSRNLTALTDFSVTASNSNIVPDEAPLPPKKIVVNLTNQTLTYFNGDAEVGEFNISSGLPHTPTPVGTFTVLAKIPVKEYIGKNSDGSTYDLKNTKWNLQISNLGYYIHGAYWHHNFGHPMSHGCINVSYADMPELYDFADIGTSVIIQK